MKILIDEEVVKQALKIACKPAMHEHFPPRELLDVIYALRSALDAAKKVEPFGYLHMDQRGRMPAFHFRKDSHANMIPVFTHPAPAVSRSPEGTCYYPNNGVPEEWQPIETAPYACDMILAGTMDHENDWRIKVGHRADGLGAFRIYGASWTPKFWMPLPDVPSNSTILYAAPTLPTNTDELRDAARAVVEWECTGEMRKDIDRLRKAL